MKKFFGSNTSEDLFLESINRAVKERMDKVLKEEVIKAQQAIADRMKKEVDHLALSVLAYYSVERFGTELRITVKKEI